MRTRIEKRIGGAGGESGLTIIEVLVASIVLVLGAGATFGVLGAATKNAQRAKATQVTLDLAQEELERLRAVPYEKLALNRAPASAADPLDPGYRVSGSQFALRRHPLADYDTLAVDLEKGDVSPESALLSGDVEQGGIKGTVYRYVVWRDDPTCPEEECPGEEDYKQLVVAVKPDKPVSQTGERGYVEVQSNLIDPAVYEGEPSEAPDEGGEGEPGGGGGDEETGQQFFLSDTPCSPAGTTAREEIVEDHLLHNTLGTCASGPQTGTTPGAPDALLLNGAPDPAPLDEFNPALFDYADDFYLEPTPDTDKGVQVRRDDTNGCHYDPSGATNPETQVHRWVSDPMPSAFEMTEYVTLEFYTRTINDGLYTGALCVFLFDRGEAGSPPVATDELLVGKLNETPYWLYEPEGNGYWPRNSWTRVRLTMAFQKPHTIEPEHRLGVALSVERSGTEADIAIIYDHPNYPTRLEVDTPTPLGSEGEEEEGEG